MQRILEVGDDGEDDDDESSKHVALFFFVLVMEKVLYRCLCGRRE